MTTEIYLRNNEKTPILFSTEDSSSETGFSFWQDTIYILSLLYSFLKLGIKCEEDILS